VLDSLPIQVSKFISRGATVKVNRRQVIRAAGAAMGGAALASGAGCEQRTTTVRVAQGGVGGAVASANEEYVWLSANANLPLFVAHDHPALQQAGRELGVQVTIAGPDTVDIPSLISAIEQTTARRPTGMMVVGWDPSALVPAINKAVSSGIPVVCVDADVPASQRMAFIGTDWTEIGIAQGKAMLAALGGRKGKVSMQGLVAQTIDQDAFAGFRSVVEPAGLTVLEPQEDQGNQAETTRVAAALIQAHPDLVGMSGFDSESGPGMGQAIKEAGKAGKIIATTVEAEKQVLHFIKEGIITAGVKQKRPLFTYQGLRALFDIVHSTLRFTPDDKRAGIVPIPVRYSTGMYTVTRENVDLFL
jgi:ABC-type sugar transport system substrate-binding protein